MIFISPPSVPLAIRPEPTQEQIEAWCAVIKHWRHTYHPVGYGGWYTWAITQAQRKNVNESRDTLRFHCKLPHDIVIASFALIFPNSEDYIPY